LVNDHGIDLYPRFERPECGWTSGRRVKEFGTVVFGSSVFVWYFPVRCGLFRDKMNMEVEEEE
jgi:hypothetical protein